MIYKDEIEDFTLHMQHKLLVHKHKGGFERVSLEDLVHMLDDEVAELKEALTNPPTVIAECADVANIAMFIATKIQNRKEI